MRSVRRTLLIGGVALVKGRVRNVGAVMVEVCDELEPILFEECYFKNAPFETLHLIIRFGKRRCLQPIYQPIDSIHNELPVAVGLDMAALKCMSRDELKQEIWLTALTALVDAGNKFRLPTARLEHLLIESK